MRGIRPWWQMIELSCVTEAIRKDPALMSQLASAQQSDIQEFYNTGDPKTLRAAAEKHSIRLPAINNTFTAMFRYSHEYARKHWFKAIEHYCENQLTCPLVETGPVGAGRQLIMITRGEELTLTAVRYLRRCLLEGDIEALIAAQFNSSDYELLDDPTHFIKTAQGQPNRSPTDHAQLG